MARPTKLSPEGRKPNSGNWKDGQKRPPKATPSNSKTPKKPELAKELLAQGVDQRIINAEDSEDFLRCVLYVRMRELEESHDLKDLADNFFKVNYKTLVNWRVRWQASGLLNRVRALIFTKIVADDIAAAGDLVAREWGAIVARQVRTARSAASDKNALEAAMWLHEAFIKPRMEDEESKYDDELAYIMGIDTATYNSDPMSFLSAGEEKNEADDTPPDLDKVWDGTESVFDDSDSMLKGLVSE